MRIIAFSDTHGMRAKVVKLFKETSQSTDLYLFCGDGINDVEYAMLQYPDVKVMMAKGNCDYTSHGSDVVIAQADGKKIIVTHGHRHGVNYDTAGIEDLARQNGASLVLYGHTHCRDCRYASGVYYVNPGSMALPRDGYPPSYALIDILPSGILISHADYY